MDISLLLASIGGKGQAHSGRPAQGGDGFSQALAGLGDTNAGDASARQAGTALADAAVKASARSPMSTNAMRQALGDLPGEGIDARLADIAGRLTLIQEAGQQIATETLAPAALTRAADFPTGDLALTQAAGFPESENAEAARHAWTALASAGQAQADQASGYMRHDDAAAHASEPASASPETPAETVLAAAGQPQVDQASRDPRNGDAAAHERAPALSQAERPDAKGAATARSHAEAAALRPAEPPASALPQRGEPQPALVEGRGGESRTEHFATLLSGQPSQATATGTAAAQGSGTLSAPLNSPAWPQQFSQQVGQQMLLLGQRGGEQRIELHLNPAELGPLTISLKMNEQAAQAQFTSAHAAVRGAVEQAIPQLRETLAEQGINLGDTSVGDQRRDGARDEPDGRGTAGGRGLDDGLGDGDEGLATSVPAAATDIALDGRVDLYA